MHESEIWKVRDLRIKEKFSIDDVYVNSYAKYCGIYTSGVYMVLCRHADKEQSCFPSKEHIAEKLGISMRSVYDALKTLEAWNIIKIKKSQRKSGHFSHNFYLLMDKSVWQKIDDHRHIVPMADNADGNSDHLPKANDDMHGRHVMPTKDTQIKETQKKDTTPREVFDLEAPVVYLNLKAGSTFSVKSKPIQRIVKARYDEGRSLEDFKRVIDRKVTQWKADPTMCAYLRPSTLFRAGRFEEYLHEPEHSNPKAEADAIIESMKRSNGNGS